MGQPDVVKYFMGLTICNLFSSSRIFEGDRTTTELLLHEGVTKCVLPGAPPVIAFTHLAWIGPSKGLKINHDSLVQNICFLLHLLLLSFTLKTFKI